MVERMLRLDERLLRRCQAALSLRDFAGARTGPIATSTVTTLKARKISEKFCSARKAKYFASASAAAILSAILSSEEIRWAKPEPDRYRFEPDQNQSMNS